MPEDIVAKWKVIEHHVRRAMDAETRKDGDEVMTTVLEKLLGGQIQCWLSYDERDDSGKANAIALTKIQICEFTGRRSLLLYSVTRIRDMDEATTARMWTEAFMATSKFARGNSCERIVAYVELDYLVELAKGLIPNVVVKHFISMPLGG